MDDKENVSLLSNVSSINVPANESATKEIAENAGEFGVKVEPTAKRKYYVVDKQTEAEERREAALNQMRYLLSLCDKYSELYKKTLSTENSKQLKHPKQINKFTHTLGKEDIEGIQSELKNKPKAQAGKDLDITEYLTYFQNGKLHPYQVEGVSWLYTLFMNGTNGILADEMGLGKTVQIIALICVLLERNVPGPFLIVAPLSTIPNWASEFKRFAPEVPVVVLYGKTESRQENMPKMFRKYIIGALHTYPVVITSYQVPVMESSKFLRMRWKYIIVDEGHRIKNHKSQLALKLREFKSENRIILTGTPLQNNMMELWALLNFLLPTFFNDMETFTELFLMEDIQNEGQLIKQEESNNLVSKIHKVLTPFMLRRLKKDVLIDMVPKKELLVYCPMSDLQLKLYQSVIDNNFAILTDKKEEEE
ncbi:lymphoid-specific helicase-like, partial [Sitophilus oryzae]|uniref:Lymphoid-specific helicase-like n=1 Tax=Sitophilus oryzae TaxID=7048 RepID=A0A6J2Y385_SITOR